MGDEICINMLNRIKEKNKWIKVNIQNYGEAGK
jgi:hypothetical protein